MIGLFVSLNVLIILLTTSLVIKGLSTKQRSIASVSSEVFFIPALKDDNCPFWYSLFTTMLVEK